MSLADFEYVDSHYLRLRASYVGFEREIVLFDPREMTYKVYENEVIANLIRREIKLKNSTVERLIYLYMALISQPLVDLPPNAVCEYSDKHHNGKYVRIYSDDNYYYLNDDSGKWCKYLRKLVE